MSLKAELEQWHQAVEYFDDQNYDAALDIFKGIADSAKIHFNIGLILGRKGNHKGAIEAYTTALSLDRYLVVAYFQRGIAQMVLQRNNEALDDFNRAIEYLRGNEFIDYGQIGLDYKVYMCEVLYNRALCYFCIGKDKDAHEDLSNAVGRISEERHSWIKKAVESNGMDCPLYCVPRGVIYRPSANKLKSSKKIDFLGSAKVIASADGKDNFTGFKGALIRRETLKKVTGGKNTPMHLKSMRVKKTTPPPETVSSSLARSNTMPAHRFHNATPRKNSSSDIDSNADSDNLHSASKKRLSDQNIHAVEHASSRDHSRSPPVERPDSNPDHNNTNMDKTHSKDNSSSNRSSPEHNANNFHSPQQAVEGYNSDSWQSTKSQQRVQFNTEEEYVSDAYSADEDPKCAEISAEPAPQDHHHNQPTPSPSAQEPPVRISPGPSSGKQQPGSASGAAGASGRAGIDPLDIIRAGLVRRATLKNQQNQNNKQPQRSVTMKLPSRSAFGAAENPESGRDPLAVATPQPQNTEQQQYQYHGISTHVDDYGDVTEYGVGDKNESGNAGHNHNLPPQHPGLSHAAAQSPSPMMTPPLSHEEVASASCGIASMHIQNTNLPYAQPQHIMQTQQAQQQYGISSSTASTPSPDVSYPMYSTTNQTMPVNAPPPLVSSISDGVVPSPAITLGAVGGSNNEYASQGGSRMSPAAVSMAPAVSAVTTPVNGGIVGGGGLRRAPTKKGAMKIKFHFDNDTFNIMASSRVNYDDLRTKIEIKISQASQIRGQGLNSQGQLRVKYIDEDGELVLMTDQDDFELAKAYAGGDMSSPESNVVERLELWCSM